MFEIYRENDYNRRYRVVYFTELTELNRETEINRAIAGEYILSGFISEEEIEEVKLRLEGMLNSWNAREGTTESSIKDLLSEFPYSIQVTP